MWEICAGAGIEGGTSGDRHLWATSGWTSGQLWPPPWAPSWVTGSGCPAGSPRSAPGLPRAAQEPATGMVCALHAATNVCHRGLSASVTDLEDGISSSQGHSPSIWCSLSQLPTAVPPRRLSACRVPNLSFRTVALFCRFKRRRGLGGGSPDRYCHSPGHAQQPPLQVLQSQHDPPAAVHHGRAVR